MNPGNVPIRPVKAKISFKNKDIIYIKTIKINEKIILFRLFKSLSKT